MNIHETIFFLISTENETLSSLLIKEYLYSTEEQTWYGCMLEGF